MLIVNLTTTQQRLELCRIALTSILLQSHRPDQINLWVSKQPYLRDQGISQSDIVNRLIETLPQEGRDLIRVRWVPNIGPYRKLIPALREAREDDVLVTADDDIFYGRFWLSGLLRAYNQNRSKVVAARVRLKRINFFGKRTSYIYWKLIVRSTTIRDNYVITFGGGAVLTKAMFREKDIFDDSFLEMAATADDLWYSKLLTLAGNEVVVQPSVLSELNFIQHPDGLTNDNFPRVTSLLYKIRLRIWDKVLGFLGISVCLNDKARQKIDRYFREGLD